MSSTHSPATCPTCVAAQRAYAAGMQPDAGTLRHVASEGRSALARFGATLDALAGATRPAKRTGDAVPFRTVKSHPSNFDLGERGSAAVLDIACAFLVAFVVLVCMTFGHKAPETVVHVRTRAVATETTATTTAPPVVTMEATPPPVVARGEVGPATVVTAPQDGNGEAYTGPVDPTYSQQSCEVLSDGIDAEAGNGSTGWYRQTLPSDAVALNADRVRNCETVTTAGNV